jgi:hypothetical protein
LFAGRTAAEYPALLSRFFVFDFAPALCFDTKRNEILQHAAHDQSFSIALGPEDFVSQTTE